MKYSVINETKEEIFENDIKNISELVIKKLDIENPIFDIIITDNETIKKINKEHRNIDDYTDVISFALEDNKKISFDEFRFLGEIYISFDKAEEQAKEYGHSLKREICFLTVHGLLHLLGYDHIDADDKKVMRELEESVLNESNVKR